MKRLKELQHDAEQIMKSSVRGWDTESRLIRVIIEVYYPLL